MRTILREEYTRVCGVPQGGRGAGVQVHAFRVPNRVLNGGHCDDPTQWQERMLGLCKTDRVTHHPSHTSCVPIFKCFGYIDICLRYMAERRRYDPNSIGYAVII